MGGTDGSDLQARPHKLDGQQSRCTNPDNGGSVSIEDPSCDLPDAVRPLYNPGCCGWLTTPCRSTAAIQRAAPCDRAAVGSDRPPGLAVRCCRTDSRWPDWVVRAARCWAAPAYRDRLRPAAFPSAGMP